MMGSSRPPTPSPPSIKHKQHPIMPHLRSGPKTVWWALTDVSRPGSAPAAPRRRLGVHPATFPSPSHPPSRPRSPSRSATSLAYAVGCGTFFFSFLGAGRRSGHLQPQARSTPESSRLCALPLCTATRPARQPPLRWPAMSCPLPLAECRWLHLIAYRGFAPAMRELELIRYDELIKISGLLSERSETLATSEEEFRRREARLDTQQVF